ncbi:MAG: tRNA pseudouridine(38-40) synthase TruA, partial [Nitriliruptorales bacterium]
MNTTLLDASVRLRIDLAYDGTPFRGFARQPGDLPTVQGALEGALSRLLGQEAVTTGAGRTDRGGHASAQVVHVDVDAGVERAARLLGDLDDLRRRLDRLVGDAITVWAVRAVSDDFDARFSATERRYRYRLSDAPDLHPLDRFAVWHVGEPLSVGRMRAAARHLLGEHDFTSLCRAVPGRTNVRRVDEVTLARRDAEIHVRVRGPAFCHQQVRSMVGVLVEVGRGRRDAAWAAAVLAARD